jgi:hypothetical protein
MILITGGLASIGSHTARALLDLGENRRAGFYLDITRLRDDTGFRRSTTSSAPYRTTSTG